MAKTKKVGKRRNLKKKQKSRRHAKGKEHEVLFLLKTKLNDVHLRTYGQEFYDNGNPSVVSQILSHLPTRRQIEAQEQERLELPRREREELIKRNLEILQRARVERARLNQYPMNLFDAYTNKPTYDSLNARHEANKLSVVAQNELNRAQQELADHISSGITDQTRERTLTNRVRFATLQLRQSMENSSRAQDNVVKSQILRR